MIKANFYYFAEGDDEKKLLNVLKTNLMVIQPGKVQRLNVVQEKITNTMLRTLNNKTSVVLVFDTDTKKVEILKQNIKILNSCTSVSQVITIPQVRNLEEELIRSCNIKKISELLNSKSDSEFKRDLLHITNLDSKLLEHKFNIDTFWSMTPRAPFSDIENQAHKIKLCKK